MSKNNSIWTHPRLPAQPMGYYCFLGPAQIPRSPSSPPWRPPPWGRLMHRPAPATHSFHLPHLSNMHLDKLRAHKAAQTPSRSENKTLPARDERYIHMCDWHDLIFLLQILSLSPRTWPLRACMIGIMFLMRRECMTSLLFIICWFSSPLPSSHTSSKVL